MLLGRRVGVGSLAALIAIGVASCPASIAPAPQTLAAYSSDPLDVGRHGDIAGLRASAGGTGLERQLDRGLGGLEVAVTQDEVSLSGGELQAQLAAKAAAGAGDEASG